MTPQNHWQGQVRIFELSSRKSRSCVMRDRSGQFCDKKGGGILATLSFKLESQRKECCQTAQTIISNFKVKSFGNLVFVFVTMLTVLVWKHITDMALQNPSQKSSSDSHKKSRKVTSVKFIKKYVTNHLSPLICDMISRMIFLLGHYFAQYVIAPILLFTFFAVNDAVTQKGARTRPALVIISIKQTILTAWLCIWLGSLSRNFALKTHSENSF